MATKVITGNGGRALLPSEGGTAFTDSRIAGSGAGIDGTAACQFNDGQEACD